MGDECVACGRKCTEDERSESEGTFERSENPKGEPGVCERPRQNAGPRADARGSDTFYTVNSKRRKVK